MTRGRGGELGAALGEGVPVAGVEAPGHLPRELHVLDLVLAHGHHLALVDQDVRRLQHGVVQQADVDVLAVLARLVLELGHALQLAQRGERVEDPRQVRVPRHLGLHEQQSLLQVDAAGHQLQGHLPHGLGHLLRVVLDGDGVKVDDGDVGAVLVLQAHPVAHGAEIVADVQQPCRLDARKENLHKPLPMCQTGPQSMYRRGSCVSSRASPRYCGVSGSRVAVCRATSPAGLRHVLPAQARRRRGPGHGAGAAHRHARPGHRRGLPRLLEHPGTKAAPCSCSWPRWAWRWRTGTT